jgi:pimeloyl-ACP methyl ester carboxylesterase
MTTAPKPAESGHVEANGIRYHYQIHGEGEPLLLLHGGLGTIDMFVPILPMLTENRQVIGVDLHGHGRTELGDRPIDLPIWGAIMGLLVEALGYEQVDVMGYSMGGGVAGADRGADARARAAAGAGFDGPPRTASIPRSSTRCTRSGRHGGVHARTRRCTSPMPRLRRRWRISRGCWTPWARWCAGPTSTNWRSRR